MEVLTKRRIFVAAGVFAAALCLAAIAFVGHPTEPQHGSAYDTGTGVSNLFPHNGLDDSHLRACDTRWNGTPYGAWSRDRQTGNIAITVDHSGANDGNCANKYLERNHDKHGSGFDKEDAKRDIATGFYSRH